ncbi:uncharacterized protein [Porites lutea]|uniref:uncharacterized protein isoform X2 n=1 Tax=Porites lutea TaxID=51062 RepID=UPI003CC6A8B8
MSFYTKKELELSPSPNLYYSSTRTCEATPPVEGESEAEEKLHAGKQDTKKLLERMRELKAEAEKAIEELESELLNITEATYNLKELRALADKEQTGLRQGLQLSANYKEETYVEQLRASNEHKKEVDNTKRPLLKRIKGLFGSRKSTKRKKELQGLPLQMTSRLAERLATPEAKTSRDELATPEAKTTDLENLDDLPDVALYAKGRQREEFEIERSGLRRRPSSSEGIEIGGSALRRKASSGEVSVVSIGITFSRKGSQRSLPTTVGLNFRDEVEEPEYFKGAEGGQRSRSSSGSIRLPQLKKKLSLGSKDYQPVQDGDPDDFKVDSLTIMQQPTDQKGKEGTKVVFRCEARGKNKVTYQWLKDGLKLQGQTNSSLVFDSVKPRDFGCYCCEVRCSDGQNKSEPVRVLSGVAELDVLPREGMRFRYLTEVFRDNLEIQESVEKLLQKTVPDAGGWKKLAHKYKMTEETIGFLDGNHEGGKGVIDYLKSTYPELTGYDFCKDLKDIGRNDIIKTLSDQLVSVAN